MYCPHCGLEILDSNPKFCPRCGKDIITQLPTNSPKENPLPASPEPSPAPISAQPPINEFPKPEPENATFAPPSAQDKVSAGWYVLAAALAIVGGLVGYFSVKDKNLKTAKRLLYVGGGFTVLYLIAFASIDASILGTSPPSVSTQQSTGKVGMNPDGGPGLYIEHIRFVNGAIDIVIENYASGNSELGRIAIVNTTTSQGLISEPATIELQALLNYTWATYGWPCNPAGSCSAASTSTYEFQLGAYISANNARTEVISNGPFEYFPVGPYPTTITVVIPYHYFAGYRYFVIVQDQNDVTQDLAWNAPAS